MALKRGIVELNEYDSKWKLEYLKEEALLKKVLKDKIIEIHHIGSTSIPGLKAKPVIDIIIVIKNINNIKEIENLLKEYDYENKGPQGVEGRCFFVKGSEEARSFYIHFTEELSDTYYNQIYFKRYLLEHPKYLKEYCDLKEILCSKYSQDRKKYTQGKSNFISNVIKLAKGEYDD